MRDRCGVVHVVLVEADGSIRTDVNYGDAVMRTRIALAGPDGYDWALAEIRSGKYK